MFEEIISFESFALVCIFVALAAFLVWRQMRDAAEPLEDSRDRREEDAKVTADFRSALAHYNDTEHEQPCADLEPFCGDAETMERKWNAAKRAKVEADRQARSRQAVRRAQEAARNSTVRHFAEDLSKRDDKLKAMEREIQREVLAEQRIALDQMTGRKP